MTAHPDTTAELADVLSSALAARTREALTTLLTDDVRWGGEHRGDGNECTTRDQAGDHYAGLLAAGVVLSVEGLHRRDDEGTVFDARIHVSAPDPDDFPPDMSVRLTLHDGLISDICILDPPATVEVLYVDGCPHHDAFAPHLLSLLAERGIDAHVTFTRIDTDDDARAHQFLGSPTVRVNGHDVDPAEAEHHHAADDSRYGLQCRLYSTPAGVTGRPADQWIVDALVNNLAHDAGAAAVRAGDIAD